MANPESTVKTATEEQKQQLVGCILTTSKRQSWNWDDTQTAIQDPNFHLHFAAWLNDYSRTVPGPIEIDRSKPFDLNLFKRRKDDHEYTVWRGPADGDGLTGEEEQDQRALKFDYIDFGKYVPHVNFPTGLADHEQRVATEIRRHRLLSNSILADVAVAHALLTEPGQRTLRFFNKVHGIRSLQFLGTVLRGPDGARYVLSIKPRLYSITWEVSYSFMKFDSIPEYPALALG